MSRPAVARFGCVLVASLTTISAIAACSPSPGDQVRANVRSFEKEETAEKLLARGRAFAAVGDLTRAQEYFTAAMDAGADDRVVVPALIQVCVREQAYRVAVQHAERYLQKHPNDDAMRFILGTLYSAVGDSKDAKKELERVIANHPHDPEAHFAIGVVMRDEDADPVGADAHFRVYLSIDPTGPHAEEARAALLKRAPHTNDAPEPPNAVPVTPVVPTWGGGALGPPENLTKPPDTAKFPPNPSLAPSSSPSQQPPLPVRIESPDGP